ncbi:MAG TPA: membrane protein [Deltaproteobacteria bacterium]|nr:membrane protein [Deltaproteobacteria bacterium]
MSEAPRAATTWWLTRFAILRLLGAVYAVAFLAAALQLVPLIGEHGLTPLSLYLERAREQLGSPLAAFQAVPSLFWIDPSDLALRAVAWTGFALSCAVAAGYANALMMAALWLLYSSIVHAGQEWYGYGWEIQLIETGFLAIFLCPLLDARPFPRRAPPAAVLWLFRWLIFRIMLGAGLIKLRGDPAWRDLTALFYHFETQPLPNPLSRAFHFLPHPLLRAGVLFNDLAELVAPWLALGPRRVRRVGGALIVAFQGTLILSGNLSFLNWLTIVPALACFDDAVWAKVLPRALSARAARAAAEATPSLAMQRVSYALAALVGLLSVGPVLNLASSRQIMNSSFESLALVNTYGAFGSVGRERLTVVFEGTDAPEPGKDAVWKEYPYLAQPVAQDERPRQIAPYQPRLDWQMWFAAMGSPARYPFTLNLVWKLLHNDAGALSLFRSNPFPAQPPRFVRATLYRYAFSPPGDPSGLWWTRELLAPWLPPLSADNPRLRAYLDEEGWLDETSAH